MTKKRLYTIGYEGVSWEEFRDEIKSKGIEVLIDIRAVSNSRKDGFSKSVLKENLESIGISYIHFIKLGAPKELRDLLKETGSFQLFSKLYKEKLKKEKNLIYEIYSLVTKDNCCLLCFEEEAENCHRSIVAREISKNINTDLEVIHL